MKRAPYKQYAAAGVDWLSLFRRADDEERHGAITGIAEDAGVAYKTLARRYSQWKSGHRPTAADGDGIRDARCGSNRALTEEEERQIAEHIRVNYLDKGIALTDADLANMAQQRWIATHLDLAAGAQPFKASKGWISLFKHRWAFSSKRPAGRDRTIRSGRDATDAVFIATCRRWLHRVGAHRFLQLDETQWRAVNLPVKVLGNTGAPRAAVAYRGEAKKGTTAVLCVAADGTKLRPVIVRKGKTDRCLKALQLDSLSTSVDGKYSANGFVSVDVMRHIFSIIAQYTRVASPQCCCWTCTACTRMLKCSLLLGSTTVTCYGYLLHRVLRGNRSTFRCTAL